MIKALLFDLDGVLVDADAWHYQALNQALKPYSLVVTQEQHLHFLKGLPTRTKLKILSLKYHLPEDVHETIHRKKQDFTHETIITNCHPIPEKLALLNDLRTRYRLAVCSNSVRSSCQLMLEHSGYLPLIEFFLSNEDVLRPKPLPDIYLEAARRLGVHPSECLAIEDSAVGIRAAVDAGVHLCAVKSPKDVTLERVQRSIRSLGKPKIIIPMAGAGQRFIQAGFSFPKPLIEIFGRPMIQLVVENLCVHGEHIFICRKEHYDKFALKYLLNLIAPDCEVVTVDHDTEGAACSTLLAEHFITNTDELLIANSDQLVNYNLGRFVSEMREKEADGGILTFHSKHPKWSYARTDTNGLVVEVREKQPVSPHATAGIYYYRRGIDFVKYARRMISKNIRVNNEFYIAPVYNEFIADGKKILIHEIPSSNMHGLGTPEDLNLFLTSKDPFVRSIKDGFHASKTPLVHETVANPC